MLHLHTVYDEINFKIFDKAKSIFLRKKMSRFFVKQGTGLKMKYACLQKASNFVNLFYKKLASVKKIEKNMRPLYICANFYTKYARLLHILTYFQFFRTFFFAVVVH